MNRWLALACALLIAAGCATTKVVSSWRDPGTTQLQFNKLLAVMMTTESATRRIAEDELVRLIGGTRATPSYALFPGEKPPDQEAAREQLAKDSFDAVVILKPVDTRTEVQYIPGTVSYVPTYGRLWGTGHWVHGWAQVYQPGYTTRTTIQRVETLVYDLRQDKLVWASQTETTDSPGHQQLVAEIAKSTAAAMRREGLIP